MKLTPVKLRWYPVSRRPNQPGVYVIWSKRAGARICDQHPSWWNKRDHMRRGRDFNGPKVTKWAYLWPFGFYRNGSSADASQT